MLEFGAGHPFQLYTEINQSQPNAILRSSEKATKLSSRVYKGLAAKSELFPELSTLILHFTSLTDMLLLVLDITAAKSN